MNNTSKKVSGLKQPSKIAKPNSSSQNNAATSPTEPDSGVLTDNTDDFIIGDRVWVGGTKPGHIQFIGDTKFAPGEWAGVVLDEPAGKNDGSIGGIRYFMCEPKRGVFSRLTKLTRYPVGSSQQSSSPKGSITSDGEEVQTRRVSSPTNGSAPMTTTTRRAVSPTDGVTRTTKQTKRVSASPNTGGQVLTTMTTTTVKHDAMPASSGSVKIGDRVLVGGTKAGVLRYMGTTDFATGNWCGIELDEPLGKNDGTVAGKKYFDCKMKYGLFAPVHKVTKQPGSSTVTRVVRTTRVAGNSPTSSLHKRSGSRESLGSMSTTSQRSTPGSRKSGRPQAANVSATNTALQETLREKEQHIEQLLKERDMERSEVARAAAQVDAAESQLASLQSDYEELDRESNSKFEEMAKDFDAEKQLKNELLTQLEEERRKVEDLEFQLEEEALSKGDDELSSSEDKAKFQELEKELEKERQKNTQLENSKKQDLTEADHVNILQLKSGLEQERLKSSQLEDMCKNLQSQIGVVSIKDDEIKRLKTEVDMARLQLDEAHGKIVSLEMKAKNRHSPSKMTHMEKEVATKDDTILQLQISLEHKKKEVSELQLRMAEMERELDTTKKRNQRQQEIIDNLNIRLTSNENSSSNMSDKLQEAKMHVADMQRKLNTSQEKCDHIQDQKVKVEEQLADLMCASGDSLQLAHMNEEMKSKDREIEDLQTLLQESLQQSAKSKDIIDQMKEQLKQEVSTIEDKFSQDKQVMIDRMKTLEEELQEEQKKLSLRSLNRDEELSKKNTELDAIRSNLKQKEATLMQLNIKFQESELKADCSIDQIKRVQAELLTTKQQFDALKSEAAGQQEIMSSKLRQLGMEKETAVKQKEEGDMKLKENEVKLDYLQNQLADLIKEKEEHKSLVDDKDAKVMALTGEVARLNTEFNSHKEELHRQLKEQQLDSGLSEQLAQYHKQMQELQEDFITCEKQNHDLRVDVERLCEIENVKLKLEEECIMLRNQVEVIKQRENTKSFEHKTESSSLQELLNSTQMVAQQREKDLKALQTQINILQVEKVAASTNDLKNFEEEKKRLENKINELQLAVSNHQSNENNSNPDIIKLREEKESSDAQIEFLNSVIVDMQKKNDDLTSKLQIMETGVTFDSNDINLNGIKTAVVAPRLFCDICDVFDLHDTEDCPKQAMSEESPPPSQHHADRNQQRPYCEICEIFGHDTNDCDDVETF